MPEKMASDRNHRYPASDSIDNTLLQWFALLLGTRSSLLWPTLVARPWMHCQGHVAMVQVTRYRSLRDLQPRAAGPRCANHVETDTK